MNKLETGFAKNLSNYLKIEKQQHKNKFIDVCDTPNALIAIGAKPLPVVINPNDIDKCLEGLTSTKSKNNHDLTFEELSSLPEMLANPAVILKRPDKKRPKANIITVISDKTDKDGKPFLVGVELGKKYNKYFVNRVTTIHSREKDLFESFIAKDGVEVQGYIPREIAKGNLLALNIEKAPNFLQSLRLRLPRIEENIVTYDNSITHSTASVKRFDKINENLIFGTVSENRLQLNAELNGKITENDITDTLENIKEVIKETSNRNGDDR